MNIIGSPEIVTALALAGRLSFNPLTDTLTGADGQEFMLEPPQPAPDVPEADFDRGSSSYEDPPENGNDIELTVAPDSERIQLLNPWPAWDGEDLVDMPVLVKAQGKTTTDSISPAGVWLRFRGHLDRFSDNMFMGAINAYTGEGRQGQEHGFRRRGRRLLPHRPGLPVPGHQVGGRRRFQLRRGQQPGTRRPVAPACWAARRSSSAALPGSTKAT